jgi:hypothetical protein
MAPGTPATEAVASAPVPVISVIVTVGVVYKLPGLVTVMLVITPPTTEATAVAPLPLLPAESVIVTVGVVL